MEIELQPCTPKNSGALGGSIAKDVLVSLRFQIASAFKVMNCSSSQPIIQRIFSLFIYLFIYF